MRITESAIHERDRQPSSVSRGLPWLMPRAALPFWILGVTWGWWRVFREDLLAAPPAPAAVMPPLTAAVALATAAKLLGFVSEAGFYALAWRARGERLPFWRFLVLVVSASMADLFAHSLAGAGASSAPLWKACLAGLHLAPGTVFHDLPAVRVAFGSIGLLTAIRIGITGDAQARALNRGRLETVGWTVAAWLVTHVALLWGVDLMKGMSPVGGG